jgi:hypothetical protein
MCVIAWLERQFGLLADPGQQCTQTVLERPFRMPAKRVLRWLDGAARRADVTIADFGTTIGAGASQLAAILRASSSMVVAMPTRCRGSVARS